MNINDEEKKHLDYLQIKNELLNIDPSSLSTASFNKNSNKIETDNYAGKNIASNNIIINTIIYFSNDNSNQEEMF
jgi:hypothetical protein